MSGRHAGAAHDSVFWGVLRLVGAAILVPVIVAVPLAIVALVVYFGVTGSDLVSSSIAWVIWAGLLIGSIVDRKKQDRFFRWTAALLLLQLTFQLAGTLARRHIWLTGHSHVLDQLGSWIRWIVIPLIVIRVVMAIRSGDLSFRRSRPAPESPSTPE